MIASGEALDQDVFGLHRKDASVGVALLFVRGGLMTGARQFFLDDPIDDDGALLAQVMGNLLLLMSILRVFLLT